MPFVIIPVALGSMITLGLVNVFPARRAREVLMLMGLVFATSIVLLLQVHSAGAPAAGGVDAGGDGVLRDPAIADHAAPAFVLGGRDAVRQPAGRRGIRCTRLALWTTALAAVVAAAGLFQRWHFAGFSKSQEARKVTRHALGLDRLDARPAARCRPSGGSCW